MQGANKANSLGQPEKLSVVEHKFGICHNIKLGTTSILDITLGYMDYLIRETTETRLHHRHFNKGRGFNPIQSWYSVANMIKEYCNKPIWRQNQDKHMTPPTSTPLAPVQLQSWVMCLVYRKDDLNLTTHQTLMMRAEMALEILTSLSPRLYQDKKFYKI